MTDDAAVEVRELVKRYPKRETNAVDSLSFTVSPSEIFGLLGPNGAGKSTTIGILTTRVIATSGDAYLAGIDVRRNPVEARARLAVVPQQSNLDRSLTPRQNLTFHAAYHGVTRAARNQRAATLLDEFGLGAEGDVKVNWYSGGMAQRLMIARALMHEPQVLFLDEPTTGLDPQARLFVWDRIRDMRGRGVTIVLTTHDMDEAAALADRVGIIDHGKLLALDTPEALTRGLSGQAVLEVSVVPAEGDNLDDVLAALLTLDGVKQGERVGGQVGMPAFPPGGAMPMPAVAVGRMSPSAGGGRNGQGGTRLRLYLTEEPAALLAPVATALAARSATLTNVHIGQPSLEDVFIHHTGRSLR